MSGITESDLESMSTFPIPGEHAMPSDTYFNHSQASPRELLTEISSPVYSSIEGDSHATRENYLSPVPRVMVAGNAIGIDTRQTERFTKPEGRGTKQNSDETLLKTKFDTRTPPEPCPQMYPDGTIEETPESDKDEDFNRLLDLSHTYEKVYEVRPFAMASSTDDAKQYYNIPRDDNGLRDTVPPEESLQLSLRIEMSDMKPEMTQGPSPYQNYVMSSDTKHESTSNLDLVCGPGTIRSPGENLELIDSWDRQSF